MNLEDLVWVLAYGSNANPAKLHRKGLDDVVMLDATITDARAVWCRARRMAGDVVATLVRSPGHVESCPVLGLNPTQLGAVDLWEGHPVRYRREPFWGVCTVRTGLTLSPHVYVGTAIRPPLLLNGEMVGLHDLPYCDVDLMVETTALSTTD